MKILITGATGLVGRHLTERLLDQGHTIHFLTTQPSKQQAIPGATGFLWNPKASEFDPKCWEGVTVLIHLAGTSISIPWTKKNKKDILDSRIATTAVLIESLQSHNIALDTVVSASAIGWYSSSLTEQYLENAPSGSGFLADVVKEWETAVAAFESLAKTVIRLRIGLVLSTKGGVLPTLAQPITFGFGAAFGSGKQGQSWIHIEDLCRLFEWATTHSQTAVYNAVAPHPVSQKELIKTVGRVLNRPVFLPNIPAFLIRLALGDRSALVLNSQFVQAKAVQNQGFEFQFPHLEMALRQLYDKKI